jgi:organic hydroperoxide reductase OsmC/OhrA
MKQHNYEVKIEWTGNKGSGTFDYRSYSRSHIISGKEKKVEIPASSDPSFMGDESKYNPEELFLSSLSACHMLWYLHLCAINGVIVLEYIDLPKGTMHERPNGSGFFSEVTLYPEVVVSKSEMIEKANQLHRDANKMCFIANSCNFEVKHVPTSFVK